MMKIQSCVFILALCTVYVSITLVETEQKTVGSVGPRLCDYLCERCEDYPLPSLKFNETDLARIINIISKNRISQDVHKKTFKENADWVKYFRRKGGVFICRSAGSKQTEQRERSKQNKVDRISNQDIVKNSSKQDVEKKRYAVRGSSKQETMKTRLIQGTHKQKSRKRTEKEISNKGKSRQNTTNRRLLVFDRVQQKNSLYQLYLNNNSLAPYSYLKKTKRILAAAYISSLKKLVISTATSLLIASIDSDQRNVVQGTLTSAIKQLFIDETNQLVIMLSKVPSWCIKTMKTNSENLTIAFKLQKYVSNMATDPKRSTIYISHGLKELVSYTYQGKVLPWNNSQRKMCHGLMLDSENDVLYLREYSTIYKSTLPKFEWEMFVSVKIPTHCFYIFDKMFYFSHRSNLYIRDINHNTTQRVNVGGTLNIRFLPVL